MHIPNVGTLAIPASVFPTSTNVTVRATATTATDDDFNATALLFRPGPMRMDEVRISTSAVQPTGIARFTLTIPQALLHLLTPKTGIQAFVQVLQEGGDDSIDGFELVPSSVDIPGETLSFDLAPEMFTSSRTADGTFEAIVTLAITPGPNST